MSIKSARSVEVLLIIFGIFALSPSLCPLLLTPPPHSPHNQVVVKFVGRVEQTAFIDCALFT
jgi:hypothetical protein